LPKIEIEVGLPSRVISVKMPLDAVAKLDAVAQHLNITRSELVRKAIALCLKNLSKCAEVEEEFEAEE
jgi:metal-responsive CopG/Arc/MetJ family transcriptional regulator